jgi:hypothetical protein
MARDPRTKDAQDTFPTGNGVDHIGSEAAPIHVNIDMSNVGGDLTVAGSATVGTEDSPEDLTVWGAATVEGDINAGSNVEVTGSVNAVSATLTGDIVAAGGMRRELPAFTVTLAADQTALATAFSGVAGVAGWVARRAGSVTGFSANLDTAVTGSSKVATLGIYKNGTLMNALTVLAFTSGAALVKKSVEFAKDTYTFVADDVITVKYTSDTITSTPKVWAVVEVEC